MTVLLIDKPDLEIGEVVAVARERIAVDVSDQAVDRIEKSRALVERWVAEFERELHLGRVHANEVKIGPVKIYPPEFDGDVLIGLKLPMAPNEGRKLAARAYGDLEHQERHDAEKQQAPLSVKCYGVIGVPKRFIDRAIDINLQKDELRAVLEPLAGRQMWVEVKTQTGEITRKKRDLRTVAMRRLQSSEINLQAVYRHIPVLPEQVRSIRLDQVKNQTTVANTAAELIKRLDEPEASSLARADIARLKGIPANEVLSRPSLAYPRMRARVTFARRIKNKKTNRYSKGKRTLPGELPILYPVHPAWPDPEITLPSFKECEGPPRRLQDDAFVVSLNFYRRKPQYRGEKKRGRKKATA